jgi:TonB family protein
MILIGLLSGLAGPGPVAGEEKGFLIESRLFRGTQDEKTPLPGPAVIIKSFSDPEFLPAPPTRSSLAAEFSFVAAMKRELRGVFKLSQVEALCSGRIVWDGSRESLIEAVVLDEMLYSLVYHPRVLEDGRLALRIEASRHLKTGDALDVSRIRRDQPLPSIWVSGEKILDTELALGLDDPVVLGFPVNGQAYFLSLRVRKSSEKVDRGEDLNKLILEGRINWPPGFYVPPKPRFQVTPVYPASCKERNIEGTVSLLIRTNKEGAVTSIKVRQKAHPDLDTSAVEALRQWKFEPDLANGKPVPSVFFMSVDYKLKVVSAPSAPAVSGKGRNP